MANRSTAAPPAPLQTTRLGPLHAEAGQTLLHVFNWPKGNLVVPGLKNKVEKAYLLSDPEQKPLPVSQNDDGVTVKVPEKAPDPTASVVVLTITGPAEVAPQPSK